MRFLKKKIQASRTISYRNKKTLINESEEEFSEDSIDSVESIPSKVKKARTVSRGRKKRVSHQEELATKNMIKNYGRAISNFAASDLSVPYIEEDAKMMNINITSFKQYAYSLRDFIKGIEDFRNVLMITHKDSKEQVKYKKLFQISSVIFLKYFCVNWIFSGKISYKMEYLKYRCPLLRRIKEPSSFTYLKSIKLRE